MTENKLDAVVQAVPLKPFYRDERTVIYNADCREVLPYLPRFGLLLTDPPYGIGLSNHDASGVFRKQRSWAIENDESTDLAEFVIDWAKKSMPVCVFASPDKPYNGTWRNRLVWHKHGLGMGGDPATCWRRDWELILIDGNTKLSGGRDSAVLTGFDIRPSEFGLHPCAKPIRLMAYLIEKLGAETILDPFMGSGTTLVAAKLEGRYAVGIEISEDYCRKAAERLRQGVLF